MQEQLPGVKEHHTYMGNVHFNQNTPQHIELLKRYGYWQNILNNRHKFKEQGLEAFNVKAQK